MPDPPGQVQRPPDTPSDIQQLDDFYDYLKHLTTLATGLIAIVVTFREKFTVKGQSTTLLIWSIGLFLCCVVLSIVCMFFSLYDRTRHANTFSKTMSAIAFYGTAITFAAGLICLAVFAGRSLQ